MSYAGPARKTPVGLPPKPGQRPPRRPSLPAPTGGADTDWGQVAIFGAGLALGILVGAGAALLTAPQSGQRTRAAIRTRARRTTSMLGRRSQNAWHDLQDELRSAAGALRTRKIRREVRQDLQREIEREMAAELE